MKTVKKTLRTFNRSTDRPETGAGPSKLGPLADGAGAARNVVFSLNDYTSNSFIFKSKFHFKDISRSTTNVL